MGVKENLKKRHFNEIKTPTANLGIVLNKNHYNLAY